MRKAVIFSTLLCLLLLAPRPIHAQMDDEAKRQLFLKARQDIRPVPRSSAEPTPRPKPKTVATPRPEPTPAPQAPQEEEEAPKVRPTPAPKVSEEEPAKPAVVQKNDDEDKVEPPKKKKTAIEEQAEEDEKSSKESSSKTSDVPVVKPQTPKGATASGDVIDAPIVIEKSGLQADQGLEPAPKSTGGWFKRWKYLSPAVRKAIDKAPVKKGRWKYIIVHNSGTRQGNAKAFDNYHRRVRKMQNGLAYHFVIGNGTSSGDGEIEIGPRWTKQINGGHVASDYLNNIAIGICLVGDLNRDVPTKAEMAALDELITYLRGRVGKVKGKPAIVVPHKMINPKPTDCPGDRFPYSTLRQKFGS